MIKFMTIFLNDEEKEDNETTDYERTTFDEGKGMNDERGGEAVALVKEAENFSIPSSKYLNENFLNR